MFILKVLLWLLAGFVAIWLIDLIVDFLARRFKVDSVICMRLVFFVASIIFVLVCAFIKRVDNWVVILYVLQAIYFWVGCSEMRDNTREIIVRETEIDTRIKRDIFGTPTIHSSATTTSRLTTEGLSPTGIQLLFTLLGPIAAAVLTLLVAGILILFGMDSSSPLTASMAFVIVSIYELVCCFVGVNWMMDLD